MEIEEYRKIMESHGPCGEGADMFRACGTRAEVFRTALSPLCTGYLLRSMQEGWGPAPEDIGRIFARYANGGMTVENRLPSGRTVRTQLWTGRGPRVLPDGVSRLVLAGFVGDVKVERAYGFLEVYSGPATDARIVFPGDGLLLMRDFGGTCSGEGCRIRTLKDKG